MNKGFVQVMDSNNFCNLKMDILVQKGKVSKLKSSNVISLRKIQPKFVKGRIKLIVWWRISTFQYSTRKVRCTSKRTTEETLFMLMMLSWFNFKPQTIHILTTIISWSIVKFRLMISVFIHKERFMISWSFKSVQPGNLLHGFIVTIQVPTVIFTMILNNKLLCVHTLS